ncbi:NAD(P)/FAD-dependent oxidoreductase [uncultured Dechloromonas sp.]|uniref:NAD(P)/FAD-dependent oxidoreductase n=1 Tax=uncultured Dechloromonas sp. TaxID=171719 RepID=UPI0025D41861|nr:NAD(P)/FAD-dependent oxidoreductase [uncultured Dechloromonas sp.]
MRRKFLKTMGGGALALLAACATRTERVMPRVVVVGGGFAGATVAKYLRLWSRGEVAVTLVERNRQFVSCPVSNLVLAGERSLADITLGYAGLAQLGVEVVHAQAERIDPGKRTVLLSGGLSLPYDRCVLAPGVDFINEDIPGLASEAAQRRFPHAYKAGAQTVALRNQLAAMPDGGVYALSIPRIPYVCPPGPYERASLIAAYFRRHKPRSKVLILDANDGVASKRPLFLQAWAELYPDLIDYRPNMPLRDVDAGSGAAIFDFEQLQADVWNVIPAQRIGRIARELGLKLANGRWAEVDWLTLESLSHPGIHVIGDATFAAPLMPKSGHMANQQAKVLAAALVNLFAGRQINPRPKVMNTCYSFVSFEQAMHVASVFDYDAEQATFLSVAKSGGLSERASELEAGYAHAWARNIWADSLSAVH